MDKGDNYAMLNIALILDIGDGVEANYQQIMEMQWQFANMQ